MVNIWEVLGQLNAESVVSVSVNESESDEINCLADDGGAEPDDYEVAERLAIQSVEAENEFNRAWPAAIESLHGVLADDVVACLLRAEFGGVQIVEKS